MEMAIRIIDAYTGLMKYSELAAGWSIDVSLLDYTSESTFPIQGKLDKVNVNDLIIAHPVGLGDIKTSATPKDLWYGAPKNLQYSAYYGKVTGQTYADEITTISTQSYLGYFDVEVALGDSTDVVSYFGNAYDIWIRAFLKKYYPVTLYYDDSLNNVTQFSRVAYEGSLSDALEESFKQYQVYPKVDGHFVRTDGLVQLQSTLVVPSSTDTVVVDSRSYSDYSIYISPKNKDIYNIVLMTTPSYSGPLSYYYMNTSGVVKSYDPSGMGSSNKNNIPSDIAGQYPKQKAILYDGTQTTLSMLSTASAELSLSDYSHEISLSIDKDFYDWVQRLGQYAIIRDENGSYNSILSGWSWSDGENMKLSFGNVKTSLKSILRK